MPHPLSHQLEVTKQRTNDKGELMNYCELVCEIPNTWASLTIWSSGIDVKNPTDGYNANKAFAERIVKALALLEMTESFENKLSKSSAKPTHN